MLTNFSQLEDKQPVYFSKHSHEHKHKHKHKHRHDKHISEIKSQQVNTLVCLPPKDINNLVMLEEIVHQCPTGFGDCVTGYVSSYLFKKKLEKRFHKILKLSIDWSGVVCPYIKSQHIFKGDISTDNKTIVVCFYAGPDGTASFNRYYSGQLLEDVSRKTHIMLTINQFVGRCFIDTDTSREDIKIWTYEAYKYFWEEVLDQCLIIGNIGDLNYDYQEMVAIYVRLGDQYLCEKCNGIQRLTEYYSQINTDDLRNKQIVLIGDSENTVLVEVFKKVHNIDNIVQLTGSVVHSCGNLGDDEWIRIFTDLYLLLRSKTVFVLSNNSNFVRIVLFLKNVTIEQIHFMVGDKLTLLDDSSIVFAKHYQF